MRRSLRMLNCWSIASIVMLSACSTGDSAAVDTAPAPSADEPTATSSPVTSDEDVGTAVFTIVVDQASAAPSAARALELALAPFDAAPATVEGNVVRAGVEGITYGEARSIDLRPRPPLALRPVVDFDQAEDPGSDLLSTADGAVFAVGPAQADRSAFGRAEAVLNPEGWSINIEIGDEPTWNSLAQQCFNRLPTCPSGQLAIVVDGEVLTAPTVNQPTFQDSIEITGIFDEAEARSVAAAISGDGGPFSPSVIRFEFIPDE